MYHNNNNISSNNEKVNNEDKSKTIYFPININALENLESEFTETNLFLYLVSKMTLNNGIVGVFHRITEYSLKIHFKVVNVQVARKLKSLEKKKLIKVLNKNPLIIQVLEVYRTCTITDLNECLKYVKSHEDEFNFNDIKFINVKNRFYEEFKNQYITLNNTIKQKEHKNVYEAMKEQQSQNTHLKCQNIEEIDYDNPFFGTEPNS